MYFKFCIMRSKTKQTHISAVVGNIFFKSVFCFILMSVQTLVCDVFPPHTLCYNVSSSLQYWANESTFFSSVQGQCIQHKILDNFISSECIYCMYQEKLLLVSFVTDFIFCNFARPLQKYRSQVRSPTCACSS